MKFRQTGRVKQETSIGMLYAYQNLVRLEVKILPGKSVHHSGQETGISKSRNATKHFKTRNI